jgi:hypothetical protein
LGLRVRSRRIDLKLCQRDIASQLGGSKVTMKVWEKSHHAGYIHRFPKITEFVGPVPLPPDRSAGSRSAAVRRQHGLFLELGTRYLHMGSGLLGRWK